MSINHEKNDAAQRAADLLKRLENLQGGAQETLTSAKETIDQISMLGRGIHRVAKTCSWLKEKTWDPVMSIMPFAKPLAKAVSDQYAWFCYPAEPFMDAVGRGFKNFGNKNTNRVANIFRKEKEAFELSLLELGEFSRTRAGIATLVTAFAASPMLEQIPFVGQFLPDPISEAAYATLYEPPYDATKMALTAAFNKGQLHKETIYLNGKNEIDPKNNLWSANGCEEKPNCTSEDAITFRIKPSLMHHAWSFATGRGPFLPDYVAATIPNVPSECHVTSYGLRWRIAKWADVYPMLLDVQCNALGSGAIPQPH